MSDSVLHSLAGAAGGMVAMTMTYPLIFLSTRDAVSEAKKHNNTTYEALKEIISREGLGGLYSGLSSSLVGIAVTNGVYYFFYERTRQAILASPTRSSSSKALTTIESMLSGLLAGTATTVLSNPIWVTQVAQSTRTLPSEDGSEGKTLPKKLNMVQTMQFILRKDGIAAFWRGLGPALALVTNPILQYTVFEQLKNFLIRRRTARSRVAGGTAAAAAVLSDLDFFWLGALSKLMATSMTYPYIVVKSRLQADSAQARAYKSAWHGLSTILKNEGIEGLYKGIGNKLIQSVLTAAILFASQRRIYETIKRISNAKLAV